ncbi:hypothetical protein KC842_00780 [Candidatus Nomurabacteria bacterium]|nr:hypothetical protein [Candidatus Nomurabacteria bacterium]USN95017.1 MAG: hypothetical protein H6791_01130 [Candidatus Nomurabacteria bacterium]
MDDLSNLRNVSGIYIIKFRFSKRIYSVGESQTNLYSSISRVRNRLKKDVGDYHYAVVPAEVGHFKGIKRQIKREYLDTPIDTHYNKVKRMLDNGRKKNIIKYIRSHTVAPFYKNKKGEDRFSLKYYKWRFGIYFIFEEEELVYIGMSGGGFNEKKNFKHSWVDVTSYAHFTKYPKDRETSHRRVYFDRNEKDYRICIMEIPFLVDGTIRTLEEVREDVNQIEKGLIRLIEPRDNLKGLEDLREKADFDFDFNVFQ